MKITLAIGLVVAYLVVQATGLSDVPSITEELLFPSALAIVLSLALLRFCKAPIWLPPLIVGLCMVALNYPVQTLVGHVAPNSGTDEGQAQQLLFAALSVARVAPLLLSLATSLAYRSVRRR